jgi:hypothetical protein
MSDRQPNETRLSRKGNQVVPVIRTDFSQQNNVKHRKRSFPGLHNNFASSSKRFRDQEHPTYTPSKSNRFNFHEPPTVSDGPESARLRLSRQSSPNNRTFARVLDRGASPGTFYAPKGTPKFNNLQKAWLMPARPKDLSRSMVPSQVVLRYAMSNHQYRRLSLDRENSSVFLLQCPRHFSPAHNPRIIHRLPLSRMRFENGPHFQNQPLSPMSSLDFDLEKSLLA